MCQLSPCAAAAYQPPLVANLPLSPLSSCPCSHFIAQGTAPGACHLEICPWGSLWVPGDGAGLAVTSLRTWAVLRWWDQWEFCFQWPCSSSDCSQFALPVWHWLAWPGSVSPPCPRRNSQPCSGNHFGLHENFPGFDICVCWEAKRYRNLGNAERGREGSCPASPGSREGKPDRDGCAQGCPVRSHPPLPAQQLSCPAAAEQMCETLFGQK